MHTFNESFNAEQSGIITPVGYLNLGLATPCALYPNNIYIDPRVQLPLYKQDMTKYPKSYKVNKTDIIATNSK